MPTQRTRVAGACTGIVAHITYDHHFTGDEDVALCGLRIVGPYLVGSPMTTLCTECARLDVEPSRTRDSKQPDPNPTISIQHRCSRMREHVVGSWRGTGKPGSHPSDLPVPCGECYSIVVTAVAIPWQPNQRKRGI